MGGVPVKKKRNTRGTAGSQRDVQELASATEQTGLIPAAPGSEAECAAYEAMWPLAGQKSVKKE